MRKSIGTGIMRSTKLGIMNLKVEENALMISHRLGEKTHTIKIDLGEIKNRLGRESEKRGWQGVPAKVGRIEEELAREGRASLEEDKELMRRSREEIIKAINDLKEVQLKNLGLNKETKMRILEILKGA